VLFLVIVVVSMISAFWCQFSYPSSVVRRSRLGANATTVGGSDGTHSLASAGDVVDPHVTQNGSGSLASAGTAGESNRSRIVAKAGKVGVAKETGSLASAGKVRGRRFILVSGLEGSGTTSLARALCEMPGAVAITTNWKKSELSTAAQVRFRSSKPLKRYQGALRRMFHELWTDNRKLPYIQKHVDKRKRKKKERLMGHIGFMLRKIFRKGKGKIHTAVLHRSMPFDKKWKYPFLEDLSTIAHWFTARPILVISTRDVPSAIASNAHEDSFFDHANKLGELMTHPSSIPHLQVVFSDLRNRSCSPLESMVQLCDALGCDPHSMVLGSPEFNHTAPRHNRSQKKEKALSLVHSLLGVRKGFDTYVNRTSHGIECS
jgi:hypothetical protein